MSLPPAIPIIFLALGALAVGASNLAHLRRPSLVMTITAVASLAALLAVPYAPPVTQIIAAWQPVSVFTVPLSFRVDQTAWILAFGFMLMLIVTALTWVAYPGQHRSAPRAFSLLLIAAAIAGVFASNLLTLAIAWGLLDLIFVSALLLRSGPEIGRRAALAIVFNVSSTVCIWTAALLIENQGNSLYWHLFNAQAGPRWWLAAAMVLRVGLYPFHQWLPVELGKEPDRSVLLFTVPAAAGLALWIRMALARALPAESIVPLLAVLSAIVGAGLAWRSASPRTGLPYAVLALSGIVVLGGLNYGPLAGAPTSGAPSGILIAATLNWMFVLTSLFISRSLFQQQPFWLAGVFVAILSLAGLPGTLGFTTLQPLFMRLIDAKQWPVLAAVILAQAGVLAVALRLLLEASNERPPQGVLKKISWALAIALAAAPLILWALVPDSIPGLPTTGQLIGELSLISLIVAGIPIGLGIAGVWLVKRAETRRSTEAPAPTATWQNILRLEWLNNAFFYVVNLLAGVLRGMARVIEGEGGLLWTLVLVVIVIVLSSEALK